MIQLIIGGQRSGKTAYAESLAEKSHLPVCYLATAQALDGEMQERIELHRDSRNKTWETLEEPLHLHTAIREQSLNTPCILIDCLSLWVCNLMSYEDESVLESEIEKLYQQIENISEDLDNKTQLIFVSNEVSLGVIPFEPFTRKYIDILGKVHQRIASYSDEVYFVVAGIPQKIKFS